jgi:hypothetical protein
MLISKTNRRAIYEALFKEGVLTAPKEFNAPTHPDIPNVKNLEVIKAMQSLTSKGFVKTQFSWQWYYYVLTPEGLDYLREVSLRGKRAFCSFLPERRLLSAANVTSNILYLPSSSRLPHVFNV